MNIKGSRAMAMLGIFSALLGQGISSEAHPASAIFRGGFRRGKKGDRNLSPKAVKLRKARKRQENKSRSINAKVKRYV
jgi:hypothetical protein